MKLFHFLIAFLLFTLVYSCDRPACKNTNPVFDKYQPDAREYKTELVKQLRSRQPKDVRYWIDQYIATPNGIFMSMYIQGENLCAKGLLDITNTSSSSRLQYYKQAKGGGYSGAELDKLTYKIDSTNGDYRFVFEDVEHIID